MLPERRATLLIKNVGQLVTLAGAVPRRGDQMKDLGLIDNGAVAVFDQHVLAVGRLREIERQVSLAEDCVVIDAGGAVVTPGLIDAHTHPIFSMTRELEFEMRLQGTSYTEIAEAGGGIRASVRDLRATPIAVLIEKATKRLDRMLSYGVTTIEAKSGYGLDLDSELKQLQAIRQLNLLHVVDLVPTFLGAHEVPDEYREKRSRYMDLIVHEMIPAVAKDRLAEFSDVFCEKGVFSLDESRNIQQAALHAGLKLKFHADELTPFGGAELAASMKAVSADHLVYVSDAGIKALAEAGTVAVLLPGTTFCLGGKRYAPARRIIEAGVVVALSTDCNPGTSYTESLPFILTLAALELKLTAAEALTAATANAACAIGREQSIGRLEKGLLADMVIWDMADYRELPYHYAVNLARTVIKRGKVAANN
ncbi:MAG TPA: imidazolonepropionase [Candidatus Deferrimicrobium sp.]|nr:imidazolonepropionase [Candidatus Deferrimicrobium sp.]